MRLPVPTRQTDVSDILKGIDYIIESQKNPLGGGGYQLNMPAYVMHTHYTHSTIDLSLSISLFLPLSMIYLFKKTQDLFTIR